MPADAEPMKAAAENWELGSARAPQSALLQSSCERGWSRIRSGNLQMAGVVGLKNALFQQN